jgi:hypothetical protein
VTTPRVCRSVSSLVIAWALWAPLGHAHAPPAAHTLALHPSDRNLLAVHADYAGLLTSVNGGGWFELVCNAHLRVLDNGLDRVHFRYTRDGGLLLGSFRGLRLGSNDACEWEQVGPPGAVRALVPDIADVDTSYALLAPSAGAPAQLVTTPDGGRTWTVLHSFATGERATSLVVTPTVPRVFYAVVESEGSPEGVGARAIATSADGGTTWREQSMPLGPFSVVWASAADPSRVLLVEEGDPADRVVVYDGGGASVRQVLDVRRFGGVATRGDGTIWVGDAVGGVLESKDGGETFVRVNDTQGVRCLVWGHDRLWACTDNWRDGYFVAASSDDGRVFEPVKRFECVSEFTPCGDASALACEHSWDEWRSGILEPARAVGISADCAARPEVIPVAAGGCAVVAPHEELQSPSEWLLWLLAGVAFVVGRAGSWRSASLGVARHGPPT